MGSNVPERSLVVGGAAPEEFGELEHFLLLQWAKLPGCALGRAGCLSRSLWMWQREQPD